MAQNETLKESYSWQKCIKGKPKNLNSNASSKMAVVKWLFVKHIQIQNNLFNSSKEKKYIKAKMISKKVILIFEMIGESKKLLKQEKKILGHFNLERLKWKWINWMWIDTIWARWSGLNPCTALRQLRENWISHPNRFQNSVL